MIRSTSMMLAECPILVDDAEHRSSVRTVTFRVVGLDVYLREYAAWAFAGAVPALPGLLREWSERHIPDDADGFDSAIVPYLRSIRASGFNPVSSCQGGWKPREEPSEGRGMQATAVYDWDREIFWCPEPPHVFLAVGKGHGGGGTLRGVQACAKAGLDTPAATTVARRFRGMKPRIAADETHLLVILEGDTPSTDVQAQLWWDEVLVRAGS